MLRHLKDNCYLLFILAVLSVLSVGLVRLAGYVQSAADIPKISANR